MKKFELVDAFNIFEKILKENKKNVKFNYLVAINKSKIQPLVDIINDIKKPSDDYVQYEQKRIDICKKHCIKDEDGNPVMKNVSGTEIFTGLDKNEKFKEEMNAFIEEKSAVLEEIQNKNKQLNELLNEEETIEWKAIDIDMFPDDLLEGNIIEFFINIGLIKEL